MRLGLFLTTLIGLAGASHISSAADATWVAFSALENGMSRYAPAVVYRAAMFRSGRLNGRSTQRGTRSLLRVDPIRTVHSLSI